MSVQYPPALTLDTASELAVEVRDICSKTMNLVNEVKKDTHLIEQHTLAIANHTGQIEKHTAAIEKHTAAIEQYTKPLDGRLQAMVAGLVDVKNATVALATPLRKIACATEHTSKNTCAIVNALRLVLVGLVVIVACNVCVAAAAVLWWLGVPPPIVAAVPPVLLVVIVVVILRTLRAWLPPRCNYQPCE